MIYEKLPRENAANWINAVIKTNERVAKRKSVIRPHTAYSGIGMIQTPCTECDEQLEWDMVNFNLLNEDILLCPNCNNRMCVPTMVIHVC